MKKFLILLLGLGMLSSFNSCDKIPDGENNIPPDEQTGCNCDVDCGCGDSCDCGDNCTCQPKEQDGCKCAVDCGCDDDCDCGDNCKCLAAKLNTFSIDGTEYDIVKVRLGGKNEEYHYFKIYAAAEGEPALTPTVYFKYSETQFGKTVDISKTNSLMWFIFAKLPATYDAYWDFTYFQYDNLDNRYMKNKDAKGTLGIEKLADNKYNILFNAVIDDISYKCNFSGTIDTMLFD